jgi:hypothetical protein
MNSKKSIIYVMLMAITIPIGLATRKLPQLFPAIVVKYGGDLLWAALFFFIFRLIFQKKSLLSNAIITCVFSAAIELSQLYQARWINEIRGSFFGQMVLGRGFLWSDLLCYAIGIGLAYLLSTTIEQKKKVAQ